jgi:hypothetical protein
MPGPNPICHIGLFCCPARQWRNSERGADAISLCGVDGPAHVEYCDLGSTATESLIHDRDNHYGARFGRCLRHLGIEQVRIPSPRANAISVRWVESVRAACLDRLHIFGGAGLRRRTAYMSSTESRAFSHYRSNSNLRLAKHSARRAGPSKEALFRILGMIASRAWPRSAVNPRSPRTAILRTRCVSPLDGLI